MRHKRIIFLLVFLLALCLASCAKQRERKGWLMDNHAYPLPNQQQLFMPSEQDVPSSFFAEKPIVRVISGQQFSSVEDAIQKSRRGGRKNLGLRTPIQQLALNDVPLIEMAATLSEITGYNITVTKAAAQELVSVYLQDIPLRQALESICRLNDLWYREDERIVTLMTTEEYAREMVIRRNEKSRSYWLRYTNANDIARVLQATMSSKVIFNDIGKEEVYGYVDEEKDAGEGELDLDATDRGLRLDAADRGSGTLRVDDGRRSRRGSSNGNGVQGFEVEELKKLVRQGALPQDAPVSDAGRLNNRIQKDVPAVVTVFKRNNVILARSLDETILQDIGKIIELMDTPTSQVLLEISILQLNLGDGFESFFNMDFSGRYQYGYPDAMRNEDGTLADPATRKLRYADRAAGSILGSAGGLTGSTVNFILGGRDIQARLNLYNNDDRVRVISTPYLMSANNSKVEFFVGQEVPLRNDVTSETLYDSDGNVTTTNFTVDVKREELGTEIEISSFINEDGTITMDLDAKISSPQYNVTSINVFDKDTGRSAPFNLDGKETSEINSIITASSGQMVALGGIIREELAEYEKKVPLLGDIPVLGFFFKEVKDRRQKTETLILLTPHIISHPSMAGEVSSNFLKLQSSHPRFVHDKKHLVDYPLAPPRGQIEKEKRLPTINRVTIEPLEEQ